MGFAGTQLALGFDSAPAPVAVVSAALAARPAAVATPHVAQQSTSQTSVRREVPEERLVEERWSGYTNQSTFHASLELNNSQEVARWIDANCPPDGRLTGHQLAKLFPHKVNFGEDDDVPSVSLKQGKLALPDFCSFAEIDWQELADDLTSAIRDELSRYAGMSDLELLAECEIEGNVVRMRQRLDPATYARLKGALEKLGGKWSRSCKGHTFKKNPRQLIDEALSAGKVTKPDDHDFFATAPARADVMVADADIKPYHVVLEPSAGEGAIADAIRRAVPGCQLIVGELDNDRAALLREKGYDCQFSDFLTFNPGAIFDRAVLNPPFSARSDVKHVMHAWSLLKPGGRLVAIMAAGVMTNSYKDVVAFRELLSETGRAIALPAGEFKHAGTMVSTVQVVMDKPLA